MQKFFGFDSTIGVGRNFGFKVDTVVQPPLEQPVITSINEDIDMAGGVRIEFGQFGDFDSFSIYRSSAPMTEGSLPAPIAVGLSTMYYVDSDVVEGAKYYYRVGVTRGSVEKVSLEAEYTVPKEVVGNAIPDDYILAYDFDGDTLDKSVNGLDGIQVGSMAFVEGRKTGTQALSFTNGRVNSNANIPINSGVVTLSMWIKVGTKAAAVVAQLSQNPEAIRGFSAILSNYDSFGGISLQYGVSSSNQVIKRTPVSVTNGAWRHVVMQYGEVTNGGTTSVIKVYLDSVLLTLINQKNNSFYGNFTNDTLYLGRRDAYAHMPFKGLMQDVRVYNRPLTDAEVLQLFNE